MRSRRRMLMLATSSLALISGARSGSAASSTPFTIHWTAPGDDSLSGRATIYDMRYSTLQLTGASFALATRILGLAPPLPVGSPESFLVSGLPDGVTYYFALKTADEAGNWSMISNVVKRIAATTGIPLGELIFAFSAPWPNPARESTRWAWSMPQAGMVQLDIFDALGRHVRTVASGEREAGRGEFAWDLHDAQGRSVDAGVYFVKARLGVTNWTNRILVVR